jgi:hypothetical protein
MRSLKTYLPKMESLIILTHTSLSQYMHWLSDQFGLSDF